MPNKNLKNNFENSLNEIIKEMANKTKRDFVIMENEYGDVDIDSNMLKEEGMQKYLFRLRRRGNIERL